MAETAQAVEEAVDQVQEESRTQAQTVEFSEAFAGETASGGGSIDILLDMDIPVTVAIGRTEMTVRQLLQLSPGSVLQLDKPVDMPADLYLKDTRFATGNIVVVDGRFAVRIKSIIGLKSAAGQAAQKSDQAAAEE